jgi:DNA mismatch endonuclease (patch repair protein)
MQSNKSANTKPEIALRRNLWASGLRGYRLHPKNLPGGPDIVFRKSGVAIFVHGCWWHGCPNCGRYRVPRTNEKYWRAKLERNQERDEQVCGALQKLGFLVLIAWECQVRKTPGHVVVLVSELLCDGPL